MEDALDSPQVRNDACGNETPTVIVDCKGLSKHYGDFAALDDCSLQVTRGDIFGLLGPNGAGKTTLIRSLLGYLQPTAGNCSVVGVDPVVDPVAVRRRVAYLPGDARLPRHMTGRGVLRFFGAIHPSGDVDRSLEVAETLELDLSRRVAFMSTGMRQKLALAVVFGPSTPLLILDEPTANLDPTVRSKVLELVVARRESGGTVVFSSHVLSEIEQTCDRVAFLRRGKLVHRLTMSDLFQRHRVTAQRPGNLTSESWREQLVVPSELQRSTHLSILDPSGRQDEQLRVDTSGDLQPVLPWLASLPLASVRIEPLGLHTVYESVHMGRELPRSLSDNESGSGVR
ncbi:MAG: ABC transporter ATP-binding protein [Planctomycetota bacterium]